MRMYVHDGLALSLTFFMQASLEMMRASDKEALDKGLQRPHFHLKSFHPGEAMCLLTLDAHKQMSEMSSLKRMHMSCT